MSTATGELICDCCDAPLRQDGRAFRCTQCNQVHFFGELGHTTLIGARLYPAWNRMSNALKLESIDFRLRQAELHYHMQLVLGDITEDQYRTNCSVREVEANSLRAEITSGPVRRFWRRITGRQS